MNGVVIGGSHERCRLKHDAPMSEFNTWWLIVCTVDVDLFELIHGSIVVVYMQEI